MAKDPVPLLQALLRCPSVTPHEGGALRFVDSVLKPQGFETHWLTFSAPGTPDVDNLFARFGTGRPHFCFAGHTDVVPAGDEKSWSHEPFGGALAKDAVYGRGACDMKGPIAAFMAAAAEVIERGECKGSISLLLTGDEEGPAVNGTVKVLTWLQSAGAVPDHCLVGEPTCGKRLGDTMKIGRRGSINGVVRVKGKQGHSAYPHLADNPIPRLVRLLDRINSHRLDDGTEHFDPSHVVITSIDVGNPASNVIPAKAEAKLNIRFNPLHDAESLKRWIDGERRAVEAEMGGAIEVWLGEAADAFLTEPGDFVRLVRDAVEAATGITPELSAAGGTSDARFIKDYCPVVEFGPRSATIHQVDECISIDELNGLKQVYETVLQRYFAKS
ncbi:MAG TPA: succinyl-diaminopimelate desuccinylase [Aestuariivirgaceae bacterium]|jgi:succinyl-diaminopimelate desuccinylase